MSYTFLELCNRRILDNSVASYYQYRSVKFQEADYRLAAWFPVDLPEVNAFISSQRERFPPGTVAVADITRDLYPWAFGGTPNVIDV